MSYKHHPLELKYTRMGHTYAVGLQLYKARLVAKIVTDGTFLVEISHSKREILLAFGVRE